MTARLTQNAVLAALYAAVALALPATALANYRLATAFYVLAAVHPGLIPGLALGNALAGLPQGPIDMVLGGLVGFFTAFACSKLGRWAPLAVLIVPTVLVPPYLALISHVPYWLAAISVLEGQAISAVLAVVLLRLVERSLH